MNDEIRNTNLNRNILIIDDSGIESRIYKDDLTLYSNFNLSVEICNSVKTFTEYISSDKSWDIILLDMMMPSEEIFSEDQSKNGQITGYLVAIEIRKVLHGTPIILLSNAPFENVKDYCQQVESKITNCLFWVKNQMPPRKLATLLDKYFIEGRIEKPSESLLARIFGAMLLQPNIGGVGLDIKEL